MMPAIGSLCAYRGDKFMSLQLFNMVGELHGPALQHGDMFLFLGETEDTIGNCYDCLYRARRYFFVSHSKLKLEVMECP